MRAHDVRQLRGVVTADAYDDAVAYCRDVLGAGRATLEVADRAAVAATRCCVDPPDPRC